MAATYLAFRFEGRGNKLRTREANAAAASRALYTIYTMWNVLHQFETEAIKPFEGRDDRWLNMPATGPRRPSASSFDFRGLSFLLQTRYADTFATVMHEETRFDHFMFLVELRSSMMMTEAVPRLESSNIAPGSPVTEKAILNALGKSLVARLKHVDERLMTTCGKSISTLRSAYEELATATKALYPKATIPKVDFDKERSENQPPTV